MLQYDPYSDRRSACWLLCVVCVTEPAAPAPRRIAPPARSPPPNTTRRSRWTQYARFRRGPPCAATARRRFSSTPPRRRKGSGRRRRPRRPRRAVRALVATAAWREAGVRDDCRTGRHAAGRATKIELGDIEGFPLTVRDTAGFERARAKTCRRQLRGRRLRRLPLPSPAVHQGAAHADGQSSRPGDRRTPIGRGSPTRRAAASASPPARRVRGRRRGTNARAARRARGAAFHRRPPPRAPHRSSSAFATPTTR